MPDPSVFESSSWKILSVAQRVKALQEIEDVMATRHGRQSRTVSPSNSIDDDLGAYCPNNPDFLFINYDLIKSDTDSYLALETVMHEGRHAYQDDCVTGKIAPLPEDRMKVSSWAHNMPEREGYYEDTDYIIYRYQPTEIDTNDFTKDAMGSFGGHCQHDSMYQQYCLQRETADLRAETRARRDFGEDYKTEIAQIIEDKYKALAPRQQKLSDIPKDSISIKPIQQKPLPKEPDASHHQESKIAQAR
jgi:hypothetical protein